MKKKINLIFFHPYSALGGADKSLFRLINNLNLSEFNINFISLNKSILQKQLPKINFIQLNSKRVIFSLFELRKTIKKLISNTSFKKNILISNQNYANIIAFFASKEFSNLKRVFIERNHIDEIFFKKNILSYIKNMVIYFFVKTIYPKSDRIIAISKGLAKTLKSISKRSKIQLIYNPAFDKEILSLSKKNINFNFKKKYKYIICVSRLTKRKGIEELIESFYDCIKKNNNLRLILIGYGKNENNIRNLIKNHNINKYVKIIKNCNNPYPYIKKSHLFILNSKYEGFANVIVESIFLDTPVISTRCNSGPSEILLNGNGGKLIKVYNNRGILSKEILNFFKNKKILTKKNKVAKLNLQRFSIKKNVNQFKELFINV